MHSWLLGFVGLALACGMAPPPEPNVLLITLDTTRRDHSSVYGYERATTPGLERLAAGGVTFELARREFWPPPPWSS